MKSAPRSWGDRHSCLSLSFLLLLILAGCIPQSPFEPAHVRFGRVDYLEAREPLAPPAEIDLSLSRDALRPDDAIIASVRIAPSLVATRPSARLTLQLADAASAAATLDLPEIRNTQLDVHVHLRSAPPGRYTLRVDAGTLSVEKPFTVHE